MDQCPFAPDTAERDQHQAEQEGEGEGETAELDRDFAEEHGSERSGEYEHEGDADAAEFLDRAESPAGQGLGADGADHPQDDEKAGPFWIHGGSFEGHAHDRGEHEGDEQSENF